MIVIPMAFLLIVGVGVGAAAHKYLTTTGTDDKHRHRWGPWHIVKKVEVYLYNDPDDGRKIPDRVDALLERTCVKCDLPQTQTQRGLDMQWHAIEGR